jgi:hypothetical protein
MIKRNYIIKNTLDAKIIFNDLLKIYNKIEKNKKKEDENIVGILFHELMIFFVSHICYKNIKKANYLSLVFGKREKNYIFKKKESSLVSFLKIAIKFLSYFLRPNKKIFIGKNISLSFKNKIFLVFIAYFNRYKLILYNFDDLKICLSIQAELFFYKEIKKLLIKYKINLNNLIDIKNFIKKIKTKKKFKHFINQKNIIITGSLADFQNRLLANKKINFNAKLISINHLSTYGFVSYLCLKFDEFYLCDYYLTKGAVKNTIKDDNYIGIDKKKYKVLNLPNKFKNYGSDYVRKINFTNLKKKKILYVPGRTVNFSVDGSDFIYFKDYFNWQNYLADKFGKIDAKYSFKDSYNYTNSKFNILNSNYKLLNLCKRYDLIIIDYISSSAFSEIAITDVPILYFNLNRDNITAIGKKILKSRVHEVKVDIFNNYEGFNFVSKLKSCRKKKNYFNINFNKKSNAKTLNQFFLDLK